MNLEQISQSRPASGLGLQINAIKNSKALFARKRSIHSVDFSTLSSKVNLHHPINFRSICGANLVT
jgi:hypothetical protein